MNWWNRGKHAKDVTRETWLAAAPRPLRRLIETATLHAAVNWNAPDYVTVEEFGSTEVRNGDGEVIVSVKGDGRTVVTDLAEAEAWSSLHKDDPWLSDQDDPKNRRHLLMIDIDVPAWLIPSSTEGHGHLVADLRIPEEHLWEFLEAAVKIGLVEEGYYQACKSRGMTSLRLPWVKKGKEPSVMAAAEEVRAAVAEEWMAKTDDEKAGHTKAECPNTEMCLWHAEAPF